MPTCSICNASLKLSNKPILHGGKLNDGNEVCLHCFRMIIKKNPVLNIRSINKEKAIELFKELPKPKQSIFKQPTTSPLPEQITFVRNDEKLKKLLHLIGLNSHPENPLFRPEYSLSTSVPIMDFSNWIIEQLKTADYNSLYSFVYVYYGLYESSLFIERTIKNYQKLLNLKNLKPFDNINIQAYYEILTYFIIQNGLSGGTDFWIANGKEGELLNKILSIYDFDINIATFRVFAENANAFLKNIKKGTPFWELYPFYNIEEIPTHFELTQNSVLTELLYKLMPSERLHFFDITKGIHHSNYVHNSCSYKIKYYGLNEEESFKKMIALGIFENSNDIYAIPFVAYKDYLKAAAEEAGFVMKKSWNVQKAFDNLMSTNEGQTFLMEYIQKIDAYYFKDEYKDDLLNIIEYQKNIKQITDLLCMILPFKK